MKQMTYSQAATCNLNLKARVTPEQSKKIKQSWRDAKKHVDYEISFGYVFLWRDGYLTAGDFKEFQSAIDFKEIELIDDIEQPDFASQQDLWLWLGQGNQVKFIDSGEVFGFSDGVMWNFTKNKWQDCYFDFYRAWKKHTPPKLIRVNGIEVPAPLESLNGLKSVWVIDIVNADGLVAEKPCINSQYMNDCLKLGLCYATKEDAIKRAEAMMKFEVVE